MALNLKTLGTRSASAAVFVIVLLSAVAYGYASCLLLFFLVALLGLNEYYRISEKLNAAPYKLVGTAFGIALFTWFSLPALQIWLHMDLTSVGRVLAGALLLCPFVFLLIALFSDHPSNLWNILHSLLGLLYVVLPFSLLIIIPIRFTGQSFDYDPFRILGIIFLIWTNDTMAYLGGSLFGKTKMYERISPGKTWEGTLIGATCTVVVGFVLNLAGTYPQEFVWPVVALLVAALGTCGDLVESMLKRMAGVKDSGQIMPGHGGALDRFDSLIFVTPFVYLFLRGVGVL